MRLKIKENWADDKLEELKNKPKSEWTMDDWDDYHYCKNANAERDYYDSLDESALSISDLKAFYNTSTSIDKEKYPNFFEWYDDIVRSGKFKLESIKESINEGIVHNADYIAMSISDILKKNFIDYREINNHLDYVDIEFWSAKSAKDASEIDWKSEGFGKFETNGEKATLIIKESKCITESNIKHIYYHEDPTGLKRGQWVDVKEENGKTFAKWSFNDNWREITNEIEELPYHHFHNAEKAKTFPFGGWRYWLDDEVEKFWDIEGNRITGDFEILGMPNVKRGTKSPDETITEDKPIKKSLKYSQESFDKAYGFLKDATDNFTKEGKFTVPEGIDDTACENILSDYYEISGPCGDSDNPTYPAVVRAYKPVALNTTNEAFDVDKVQKRIARHNEFDNGHVLHNYEKMTSAEAEEKARLASIENPDDIYYVSYDNIMNPSSDIKWKNGQKVNESVESKFTLDEALSPKEGDRVYVTVAKKNGVVKKVNGDYIDVEADDGENPVRIDTYYANEVKKLDESISIKTFGAKGKKLNEASKLVSDIINEPLSEDFPQSEAHINLDRVAMQVSNLLDVEKLGEENWIELVPVRDSRPHFNGEYIIYLEAFGPNDSDYRRLTLTTNKGRIDVAFKNGSEVKCDSVKEIARFIAGEYGVTLNESLSESLNDYRFEVSCNYQPTKIIRTIAETEDKAIKYVKDMYAKEHTTYANDRENKWTIKNLDEFFSESIDSSMKCIAYSLREEDFTDNEKIVFTDNGAYDLEKKGINGVYLWVGYEHKGGRSNRKLGEEACNVAYKVGEYLDKKYNGLSRVDNFISSSDMCRVWIETNGNKLIESTTDLDTEITKFLKDILGTKEYDNLEPDAKEYAKIIAKRIIKNNKNTVKESYIKLDDLSIIDELGYAGAVEIKDNRVYADETTLRQIINELEYTPEIISESNERKCLTVCDQCLAAIESHEGNMATKLIYVDEEDEEESRCDWCEENGFDQLYEIIPDSMLDESINKNVEYKIFTSPMFNDERKCVFDLTEKFYDLASAQEYAREFAKNCASHMNTGVVELTGGEHTGYWILRRGAFEKQMTMDEYSKSHAKLSDGTIVEDKEILPITFMDYELDDDVPDALKAKFTQKHVDAIEKYFEKHNAKYILSELHLNKVRNTIEFDIDNGDWKHEHLYAKLLLDDFFTDEAGLDIEIESHETYSDGSDCYSAHYTIRNPLITNKYNKKLAESYTPDLLDDLVNHFAGRTDFSNIWDEIVAQCNNEDLANDVIEALEIEAENMWEGLITESKELSTNHAVVSVVDQVKAVYEAGLFDKLPVGRDKALTLDIFGPDKERLAGYFKKQKEFNYELNHDNGVVSHEFISDKYDIEIFDSFISMYKIPQE